MKQQSDDINYDYNDTKRKKLDDDRSNIKSLHSFFIIFYFIILVIISNVNKSVVKIYFVFLI